jgi:hypothetical protein
MLLILKKFSTEMFYFSLYVIHVRERLMSECFETHPVSSRITWVSVAMVAHTRVVTITSDVTPEFLRLLGFCGCGRRNRGK